MRQSDLEIAARYASFATFQKYQPEVYARLLRTGDSRKVFHMFEDGSIREFQKEEPKVDRRLKENRRVHARTRPDDILRAAKLYRTFTEFHRKAGPYARAAERNGAIEEVRAWFERPLHAAEIFEEAELFPDWDSFEIDRPRYAEEAAKMKMKDAVVRHIAKAVYENGGKKK